MSQFHHATKNMTSKIRKIYKELGNSTNFKLLRHLRTQFRNWTRHLLNGLRLQTNEVLHSKTRDHTKCQIGFLVSKLFRYLHIYDINVKVWNIWELSRWETWTNHSYLSQPTIGHILMWIFVGVAYDYRRKNSTGFITLDIKKAWLSYDFALSFLNIE